jgi:hypothetical protein
VAAPPRDVGRVAGLEFERRIRRRDAMKSYLGFALALLVAAGFGLAYWLAVRPGAGWLDGQWLYLAALPYTWTWLHLAGAVDFSPDAPTQVAAGLGFDAALAYLVGAILGRIGRLARARFKSRA